MNTPEQLEFSQIPESAAEVIKVHSRSFYLASLLLPSSIRRDVRRLYAWCRWCDDAIDQASSPGIAKRRLSALREDLDRMEQGREPLQRCSKWLIQVNKVCDVPFQLYHDLLDGMEMDATKFQIRTEEDLLLYSYRAAGSVGLMMNHLLGVVDSRSYRHAKSLGIAMQLTNIARDIGEDLQIGRSYIPSAWSSDSSGELEPSTTKMHVARLLDLAEKHYRVGFEGLAYLPWHSRLAIRSAALLYQEIGSEILRNDYDTVTQRAVVPWHRKLRIIASSLVDEILLGTRQTLQSIKSKLARSTPFFRKPLMNYEARYIVSLGLSLTLIMATALFLLVGMNPKDSSYEMLPWIYASTSALMATVFGALAKRLEKHLAEEVLPQPEAIVTASSHRKN